MSDDPPIFHSASSSPSFSPLLSPSNSPAPVPLSEGERVAERSERQNEVAGAGTERAEQSERPTGERSERQNEVGERSERQNGPEGERSVGEPGYVNNVSIFRSLLGGNNVEDAFRPLNIPRDEVPMFQRFVLDSGETQLREPCLHAQTVYKSPEKVPIHVCERCYSLIVPETAHSVVARALKLPLSMRRDERWTQLFDLFERHRQSLLVVEDLLREQEHLLVKLYRWRDAFSSCSGSASFGSASSASGSASAFDFGGKDNAMYGVLEESMKRVTNATTGFQQTIESMLVDARRKMIKQALRSVPSTAEDFVAVATSQILAVRPTPLYHPNAAKQCSVCDKRKCNVILHSARKQDSCSSFIRSLGGAGGRIRTRAAARAERQAIVQGDAVQSEGAVQNGGRSNAVAAARGESRSCTCKDLCVCLECLLRWYWQSSESLKKASGQCPSCRAPFVLEDIVPIYENSADLVVAPAPASASSFSSNSDPGLQREMEAWIEIAERNRDVEPEPEAEEDEFDWGGNSDEEEEEDDDEYIDEVEQAVMSAIDNSVQQAIVRLLANVFEESGALEGSGGGAGGNADAEGTEGASQRDERQE